MTYVRGVLVVAAALVAVASVSPVEARQVKRCGITIGAGKTGKLVKDVQCGFHCTSDPTVRCTGDLDQPRCPLPGDGCSASKIVIGKNATLDLNGFDLTAVPHEGLIVCATQGEGKCTITGPGKISAGKSAPGIVAGNKTLVLRDVTLGLSYDAYQSDAWIHASNVTLEGATLHAGKGIRADGVTIADGGLSSPRNIYAKNVTIERGGLWSARKLRASNVTTMASHDEELAGRDVYLQNVVRSKPAVFPARYVKVDAKRKLRAVASQLGAIESGRRPVLVETSCTTSQRADGPASWGVCSDD